MNIAYCATVQPAFGGLKTFNLGLVHALAQAVVATGHRFLLITRDVHRSEFQLPDDQVRCFQGNHFVFENFKLNSWLKEEKIDLALFPNNRLPVLGSWQGMRAVFIHDLLFWRFPGQFSRLKYLSRYFFMSHALKQADLVFSVSEFTAAELRAFGFQGHIEVCLEGIHPPENIHPEPGDRSFPADKPYFLFVGAHSFQKNIPALIKAFEMLRHQGADCRLILAGGKGTEAQLVLDLCEQSPYAQDIILPGFVTDAEKVRLMQGCEAFVFPSIYEGFGIPVLEAFQLGCPLICANAASLPEVAGDAALLPKPDAESLCQAMAEVFRNTERKQELIEKGHNRWKQFSWESVADVVLRSIVKNR
jgi:glycosyltransferase involved in cell wall biosynthesis